MDWATWIAECVAIMAARNRELYARYGTRFDWNLETATMTLDDTAFRIVVIGTVAGDEFLWSWANETIPDAAKLGIERVRAFGEEHELDLLVDDCLEGGLAQAKECAAIAGRILDASAAFYSNAGPVLLLFEPT